MVQLYKKALIIGATSGIGEALAAKLVSEGTKVIVVGRRQDRLDDVVKTLGSEWATAIRFDVTQLGEVESFAESVIQSNPDLDCVVVNSGIQRAFDFTQPKSVDLDVFGTELTTNYLAPAHLTTAFLPHLTAQSKSSLVYISATLALVPGLIRCPNYNASKAALHAFIMDVRQQLKRGGQDSLRMIEVFPPAVQTELHDTKHQPDLVNGDTMGMPIGPYTDKMYEGLVQGDDQFAVGPGEALLAEGGWEAQRTKMFEEQDTNIQKLIGQFLKK